LVEEDNCLHLHLFSRSIGILPLLPAPLPENYNDLVLPGSQCYTTDPSIGELTIQHFQGHEFSLHLSSIQLLKTLSLQLIDKNEGLLSKLSLKNAFLHKMTGIGRLLVKEGQYTAMQTSLLKSEVNFEAGKTYQSFNLRLSSDLLMPLKEVFPELNYRFDKPLPAQWLTPLMKQIVYQILHANYEEKTLRFYFEVKLKEYLLEMLLNTQPGKPGVRPGLTLRETRAIHETHAYILSHLDKHFTITQLARHVQINEYTLKQGFKRVYGIGLFECLQNARLDKARELLLHTNDPLKAIYTQAGYARITSFITAFRKHFGYTPGSLRRDI
jgi:AraC family transcriptional regulator, transcriptional activator of the genes for pyochelin and ferripyochelin receptors